MEMANKLCDKLLNGKDQYRDIASIALKTIIAEVNTPSLAQRVLVSLGPQLTKGITNPVRPFFILVSIFIKPCLSELF